MTKSGTPVEKLTYEEAFAELEQVVRSLEMDGLPLEEAIKTFERGQLLSKRCTDLLEKADLKIRELTGQDLDSQD